MSKSFISIMFAICAMSLNICYGMEEQKQVSKKGSRSYVLRRKKDGEKDVVVNRRQSESSALDNLKKPESPKHRTFSLLPKLNLKPKPKSTETGSNKRLSDSITPQTSARGEGKTAKEIGFMFALSKKVAEAQQPAQGEVETKDGADVRQRVSVIVTVPKLNDSQETIYELKKVLVSPQKQESAPTVNTAQRVISRKASLLRVVYKQGRSGRDSQAEITAKEYLGELGKGALFADPSPGASPRSEDMVTPRSEDGTTPRSDDGATPRSDDTISPRSEDTASPRLAEKNN